MEAEPKYRYPGINFFTKDDVDIFCGRADDAQKLFNRVMLNNTTVLHGESGSGKSSLVQAGLIPLMEKRNESLLSQHKMQYLPVTIRFDAIQKTAQKEGNATIDDNEILISQTLKIINKEQGACKAGELPYITKKENSFWYTAKLFEKNNYALLLIFDQFEEFQAYNSKQAEVFTQRLSGLFVSTMPETIYTEYDMYTSVLIKGEKMTSQERNEYNQNIKFLEQPLSVRVLFIVREDKLGTMSILSDYFPDILKNDFFLLALDENGARKAIVEPALEDGNYKSGKFSFSEQDGAVDYLLRSLVDAGAERYDPMQLQIVCSSIERKIAPKKSVLKTSDMPEVKSIISDFYYDTWKSIKKEFSLSDEDYEMKRKKIIDELVVGDRRNLVLENLLVNDGNSQEEGIIKSLVREGLLRKIPSGKDTFYQLSHDRLMNPLIEDLKDLKAKEKVQKEIQEQKIVARKKRKKFLWAALFVLLAISGLAIYFYLHFINAKRIAEEEKKYLLISTSLKRADNPTLSYVIARDWVNNQPNSDMMKKHLRRFDSSSYVYLTGIFPVLSEVISANIEDRNKLIINETQSRKVFDIKKGTIIENIKLDKNNIPLKKIQTTKGVFTIFASGSDSILIKDDIGNVVYNIPVDNVNLEDISITPDAHHLIAGGVLFINGALKRVTLPPYKDDFDENVTYEENASLFLDNNSLAVGYKNGDIVIYKFGKKTENEKFAIFAIDTCQSKNFYVVNNSDNTGIVTMATDGKQEYLFSANSNNGIDVWDLNQINLNQLEKGNDLKKNVSHITELKGHTGLVQCMTFSSDNKFLLTGSSDYTAAIWNINDMKKVATLKGPNATTIKYVSFLNGDKDIITISENNKVYLWKMEHPSILYDTHQLYRFSPFDYFVLGLNENNDIQTKDTLATKELYSAILNYLLNMPLNYKYLDDENYNSSLKTAVNSIEKMYNDLTNRKDYHTVVASYNETLLNKYYFGFLLSECGGFDKEGIERHILQAKNDIANLKILFLDTIENFYNTNRVYSPISLSISSYIDKQSNYEEALRLLQFYDDSLLRPLSVQYGSRPALIKLRRSINISWLKYYLYTGNADDAIRMATAISHITSPSITYSLYLVVAYLGSGKYDDAAKLYTVLIKAGKWSRTSKLNFSSLLSRLKEKHIVAADIDRFCTEFKIEIFENKLR